MTASPGWLAEWVVGSANGRNDTIEMKSRRIGAKLFRKVPMAIGQCRLIEQRVDAFGLLAAFEPAKSLLNWVVWLIRNKRG